jgi:prepilin-type N-terminal cleavage/methylation domain-containing protein
MKTDTPISTPSGARGFSLIELLAVIALMLLVLQLTLPSLKGLMGSKPHLIARGQLIADLNNARTQALRNGAPVYVVFMPAYTNLVSSPADLNQEMFKYMQVNPPMMDVRPTLMEVMSEPDQTVQNWKQLERNKQLILLREYLGDERINIQFNGVKFPRPKRFNRGNEFLGMQLVAYALYAEYLPGDQPQQPSRRWLSDWKRLPDGFYFDADLIRTIHDAAEISGGNRLLFSRMKNGHDDGSQPVNGIPERRIKLPYLMYNSRGELAARSNPGEMRVGNFHLALTEGGLFEPVKASKIIQDEKNQKYEFYGFKLVEADSPDVPEENKKKIWLQINGMTGRPDVLEEEPGRPRPYNLRVHTLKAEPNYVAKMIDNWLQQNSVGQAIHHRAWAQSGQWGSPDDRGKWIFIGNLEKKRPWAVSGIPRAKLMALIAYLQRVDPSIEVNFQRINN